MLSNHCASGLVEASPLPTSFPKSLSQQGFCASSAILCEIAALAPGTFAFPVANQVAGTARSFVRDREQSW